MFLKVCFSFKNKLFKVDKTLLKRREIKSSENLLDKIVF